MAGVPAGLLNRGKAPLPPGLLSPPDERGLLQKLMEDTITGQALKSMYGAATLPGDVYSGEQPVYAVNPETGEVETAPGMIERSADLAGSMTLGAGAIPRRGLELRSGMSRPPPEAPPKTLYHVVPRNFRMGEPLQSLKKRKGESQAIRDFSKRWPEGAGMADSHVGRTFFYDNVDEAKQHVASRGGKILEVDTTNLDFSRDTMEGEFGKGYWTRGGDTEPDSYRPFAETNSATAGVGPAGQPAPRGIRAYHGSPHSFDKFSSERIGTGEGAQAYGHGLYMAENEGVARQYRDSLSGWKVDGKPYDETKPDHVAAVALANREGLPTEQARSMAAHTARTMFAPGPEQDRAIALVMSGENLPKVTKAGSMYEVDIAADPSDFLDWDKPLSEQPEGVRTAYARLMGISEDPAALKKRVEDLQAEMDALASDRLPSNQMREESKWMRLARERDKAWEEWKVMQSGGSAYLNLAKKHYYAGTRGAEHGAEARVSAAKALKEAGVPGIRYLDQGSRNAGEGSHNYVVFSDELITVLKKYGLPITAGGVAALSQLAPEEASAAQTGGGR